LQQLSQLSTLNTANPSDTTYRAPTAAIYYEIEQRSKSFATAHIRRISYHSTSINTLTRCLFASPPFSASSAHAIVSATAA